MKTNVYFVRHAQPDFSIKDDLTRPLSEKGIADAKKVSDRLIGKNITAIYSSPYKRSVDTIRNFSNNVGIKVITNDNFRERRVGEWVDDFKTYSQKQWQNFYFKILDGESLKEVQERNISALIDVIKNNMGGNVTIGTHGTALGTIINYFNPGFGHDNFWSIVDKMPYILCFTFKDLQLEGIVEIEI